VLVRDAAIFLLKLWIDGLKDIALTVAAVGALAIDLVGRRRSERFLFYKVVRAGERFDIWLSLYSAADEGAKSEEGLFAGSRAGDKSFLGKLEELTGGERPRKR
jgi:hypothetical protein